MVTYCGLIIHKHFNGNLLWAYNPYLLSVTRYCVKESKVNSNGKVVLLKLLQWSSMVVTTFCCKCHRMPTYNCSNLNCKILKANSLPTSRICGRNDLVVWEMCYNLHYQLSKFSFFNSQNVPHLCKHCHSGKMQKFPFLILNSNFLHL